MHNPYLQSAYQRSDCLQSLEVPKNEADRCLSPLLTRFQVDRVSLSIHENYDLSAESFGDVGVVRVEFFLCDDHVVPQE